MLNKISNKKTTCWAQTFLMGHDNYLYILMNGKCLIKTIKTFVKIGIVIQLPLIHKISYIILFYLII